MILKLFKFQQLDIKNSKEGKILELTLDYCPLVSMFCSRQSNNLINNIYEIAEALTFQTPSVVTKRLHHINFSFFK